MTEPTGRRTDYSNADKLYFLYLLDSTIREHRSDLRADLRAAFASIRFTLAYLVKKVIELSPDGAALVADPSVALPAQAARVKSEMADIASEVISTVNFYVQEETDTDPIFDPKVAFKSKSGVALLEHDVLRSSTRLSKKDPDYLLRYVAS